jgi:hypothetical protein
MPASRSWRHAAWLHAASHYFGWLHLYTPQVRDSDAA